MGWIVEMVAVMLRVLIPALVRASRPQASDAMPQPELRSRLQRRIRGTWAGAVLVMCLLSVPGCFSRTVYVPSGEPVRIRKTIRGASVWVMGADGKPVAGTMDIPEGWYALPDEEDATEDGKPTSLIVREEAHVLLERGEELIRLRLVPGSRIHFPDGIAPRGEDAPSARDHPWIEA